MLLVIWSIALVAALVMYLHQVYTKLSNAGINHLPITPVFGNMASVIFRREHFTDVIMRIHQAFPEDRVVGQYEFLNGVMIVTDLELLKKITVKDFDYFVDRRAFFDEQIEPIFGRNLLALKGEVWKDMRSTLSPAFTSSKIRLMVPFMVEVGDQMIGNLKKKIQDSGVGYIDVESRQTVTTRYANDVIASCAFGLKVDSHVEDNQFYNMAKKATTFSTLALFKVFGYRSFPALMKFFKVQFIPEDVNNFFRETVLGAMKYRETEHIVRNDMIHLLMEAKKGRLSHDTKLSKDTDAGFATVEESDVGRKQHHREWSDNDLVAQAVLFLFAGFATVSTAMAFLLHELALNPDVQERLYREIYENYNATGGKIDYNDIQKMKYMDMVISESLRKWPGTPVIDRLCVKDYNLGKPNKNSSKDLIIRKGESIQIPMWIFHREPKYFPDPDKFDPERFSDENKHNIKPFTYMPFGVGPRNCIGSRFALCEMKVMTYQLLLNLEVSPCKKTCIPTKLSAEGLIMRISGGHWIRLKIRQ